MTRNQFTCRAAAVAFAAVTIALTVSASVDASPGAGRANYLTFSNSVALPGVILPRGSYTFEIANPGSPIPIVRVSIRDRRRLHFIGVTVSVQRPRELPGDRTVTLGESVAGAPPQIMAWYPLGTQFGHRFVYR